MMCYAGSGCRASFSRKERSRYDTTVVTVSLLLLFLLSTAVASRGAGNDDSISGGPAHRSAVQQEIPADLWSDSLFEEFRQSYDQYMRECPVFFYRRTCGQKSNGEVQVIVPMGRWKLESLLAEERVTGFMLFLRFLLETFWRKVVRNYAAEKKLVIFLDLQDVSMTQMLFMWGGLSRMFSIAKHTLKRCPGKSWSRTYIVNAPFGMGKLLDLAFSFVPFRRNDVAVLRSNEGEDANRLRADVGERCLWRGYGGKSKLGLDRSELQKAIRHFVQTGESVVAPVVAQPGSGPPSSSDPEERLFGSVTSTGPGLPLSNSVRASDLATQHPSDSLDASSQVQEASAVEGTVNVRAEGEPSPEQGKDGAIINDEEAATQSSDGVKERRR
ncbi:hypothetical protein CSUI_009089 [Cystoisospora suis]|uniref:CRAL/TRIO domain-containing protein n=1 Tax=Cystoisospora suis TaxID=483139 RepID=A0A2C6KL03_9APIC|nr:hypothetical protein CSUI_009089 [Cystoisospora suis]